MLRIFEAINRFCLIVITASEHRARAVHARCAGELRGGARGAAARGGRAARAVPRLGAAARHGRHAAASPQSLLGYVFVLHHLVASERTRVSYIRAPPLDRQGI